MSLKTIPSIPADQIIPRGSNSLSTRNKFIQNIDYERYFLNFIENNKISNDLFFDGRISDIDYGKYDYADNLIVLNNLNTVDIDGNSNLKVLPFVADAYNNLKFLCASYKRNNFFTTDTFSKLSVKSAYSNVDNSYHEYLNSYYELFLNYIETKYKNILNFEDFIKYFIMFLKESCDKSPFLKSSYIKSINCSVNITGLSIEIDDLPKDRDINKYVKYFSNPDFVDFQKLCQGHCFKIDKYHPWRLVFDINNPNAQKYFLKYNLNKETLFNTMYLKLIDYDVDIMIHYLSIFYNTFIISNSTVEKTTIKTDINDNLIIEKKLIERGEDMNYIAAKNIFSDAFWYKLYFYILLLENKVDINQKDYELNIESLSSVAVNSGLNSAFDLFNDVLINYPRSNTKKFTFVF